MSKYKKFGFTLAEVLITLGIIGIVAAMTMPSLIQKQQEKETVTKLKKVYSTIQQVYIQAKAENGSSENWSSGTDKETLSDDWYKKLSPYMKVLKHCSSHNTDKTCMGNSYSAMNTNSPVNVNSYSRFIMNDGTSVRIAIYDSTCNMYNKNFCGNIYFDINGPKKPNKMGVDYFAFSIHKDKIIPFGTPVANETYAIDYMKTYCNITSSDSSNGEGCAAWVIYNENMDYLHCDDLDWDGKKECK